MVDDIPALLERLEGVKRNGSGWKAKCPAHDDRVASLAVSESETGRLLAHCHAGCTFEDIVRAADMPRRSAPAPVINLAVIRAKPGIIAEYDYTDPDGNLLYQSVRMEPKDFRQRRPDGKGGWLWNMQSVERVPYRLPELLEAAALGKTVFVVEGEKDADNLAALGIIATTNAGGAGKWDDSFAPHFAGVSRVVILPDNDLPGEAHARRVAESLRLVVGDVRSLNLPGLPPKGDVSDWLAAGGTAAQLHQLAENSNTETPDVFPTVRVMVEQPPAAPGVHVERLLVERDVNLWTGHGGTAKSVTALLTAVCVAIGRPVFGTLAVHRPGAVLLALPEDGQAAARMMLDAIVQGLGLTDTDRALLADRLVMVSDESSVNITRDARRIGATAKQHQAVLVAGDPIRNMLGDAEENNNDVAGACLDALRREVCRNAGATLLLTQHDRKPGKDATADTAPSPHDVRGAGGWVNGSRLVFNFRKRLNRLTLTSTKANRLRGDLRHELDLQIESDPQNEAHWLSCRLTDANAGASSETLTPGKGRSLNANEQTALSCLDDRHEPGKRLSWSRWRDDSGLNPNTFKSVKDRLLNAQLATAIPTGKKTRNDSPEYAYQVTDQGRHAIASGWAVARAKGEGVSNGE